MALPPIDNTNRNLAVMAGYAAGRINGVGNTPRLPGVYELVRVDPTAPADAEGVAARAPVAPAAPAVPQVLATAVQAAVVRQDGLAPLMADLAQALKTNVLPSPAREAAARVLAQATPLSAKVEGADVAKALGGSGLLLEADLAADPGQSPVGLDLKAGLLILRQALAGGVAPASRRPGASLRPPPPMRGGAMSGQPAVEPSLDRDTPIDAQRQRLAEETDSVLARLEMMQIASLPQDEIDPVSRWMFEAPVMTPQGAAVAQFEISRDGSGRGADGEPAPAWRARFGLDIEPFGPISAHLSLQGDQIVVSIWAQSHSGAERLRAAAPTLVRSLTGPDVRAEVMVRQGTPPVAGVTAGQLLDQAV